MSRSTRHRRKSSFPFSEITRRHHVANSTLTALDAPLRRYPHGDMVVEPAWKEMFQFWMNPGPNSYSWMEHAKGEGEERSKTADAIPVNS